MDDENGGGTDSHPILRVQNYRKPQLEKIHHTPQLMGDSYLADTQHGYLENDVHNMPQRLHGRKRDNAVLAPLNY